MWDANDRPVWRRTRAKTGEAIATQEKWRNENEWDRVSEEKRVENFFETLKTF